MKKHTYKYIKEWIKNVDGYKLLSKEYNGAHSKLKLQCNKGHIFKMQWTGFQQGQRCPICFKNNQKHTYEYIKEQIEKEGYKLLSKEYIDSHSKLKMQYEGYDFEMEWSSFQQGRRKKIKTHQQIIECACGCGIEFEKYDKQGRERKYLKGHHLWKPIIERLYNNSIIDENGCWVWQKYKQKSGHGMIGYMGKTQFTHRVSYKVFKNENIENKIICHKCNNASCINPDHLYVGTQFDNVQDMVWRGTVNFNKMFPDEDIKEIRKLYKSGKYKQYELAEMFEISKPQVSKIINNKRRQEINYKNLNNVFGGV